MSRTFPLSLACAFLAACAWSGHARAVLITGTSGTLFDSGGMENQIAPNDDPNNGALPGAWDTRSEGSSSSISVQGSPSPIFAFEGNNYLQVARFDTGSSVIWANFEGGTQSGGTVHAEFAMFIPTNAPADTAHLLVTNADGGEGTGSERSLVLLTGRTALGSIDYLDPNTVNWTATGLTYATGVWQVWKYDIDFVSKTYVVTVDGNSTAALPFFENATYGADHLIFRNGGDFVGPYYVDAVPEPATGTLMAFGCVALLRNKTARSRRKPC